MPTPKFHSYLCAYDFELEDKDFRWEEDGIPIAAWKPNSAAEDFLAGCAGFDSLEAGFYCVVALDRETGEITRWNVELEALYTAYPAEE